jgi:protease PrsW
MDQWYYLDGSETRGPVPSQQIVQLIRAGQLSSSTQVAQAGWQTWSPASVALAHLLGGPAPAAAAEIPTYAIRVQCIAGPDAGKAYMISAAEVSIGRVSGIGQNDPHVADNHVVLSWQNNVLFFRTFAGAKVRVANVEVTQGTLSNGQQFQLGASTWQVGSAPIELTNLLSNLGSRLNKLTSTDKLEGFSLAELFSEVFKGRKEGEIEEYFGIGTSKTTPPLEEIKTGWPKPWFFMRVLLFMAGVFFIFYELFDFFGVTRGQRALPGLAVIGSMVVPLAVVFLFWELNTPRNISFPMILILVCLGGAASLFVSFIGFDVANLSWLGASQAGIVEETGKLLAVVLVVRNTKYRYMLNGMVFGAAIGAGFAAFETAGYIVMDGFFRGFLINQFQAMADAGEKGKIGEFISGFLSLLKREGAPQWYFNAHDYGYDQLISILRMRAVHAPITHIAWTSITACALWRVKGANKFRINMLFDPLFLRVFAIPVVLHMTWNSNFLEFEGFLGYLKPILLGIIAWYLIFTLVQQGLRQIRDMQVAHAETEYKRTQEILTTSGRFRAQPTAR